MTTSENINRSGIGPAHSNAQEIRCADRSGGISSAAYAVVGIINAPRKANNSILIIFKLHTSFRI